MENNNNNNKQEEEEEEENQYDLMSFPIEEWLNEAKVSEKVEEDETPSQYNFDLEQYLQTPMSNIIKFACTNTAFEPIYSDDGIYEISCPRNFETIYLKPKSSTQIHTGIFFEMAPGYYIETKEKPGLAIMRSIVSVISEGGIIDNDYTGELLICLKNDSDEDYFLRPGDKFAQFVIKKQPSHFLKELKELKKLQPSENMETQVSNQEIKEEEKEEEYSSSNNSTQEEYMTTEEDLEEGEIQEEKKRTHQQATEETPKKSWADQVAEENERELLIELETLKRPATSIPFMKAFPGAFTPVKGTPDAAGYDLTIPLKTDGRYEDRNAHMIIVRPNETKRISLGLIFKIPQGWYGEIRGRSGLAFKNNIKVFVSLVTSGFRGSIAINVKNEGRRRYSFYGGDKCAQIIFQKVPDHILREVALHDINKNRKTKRGANGFGSTDLL